MIYRLTIILLLSTAFCGSDALALTRSHSQRSISQSNQQLSRLPLGPGRYGSQRSTKCLNHVSSFPDVSEVPQQQSMYCRRKHASKLLFSFRVRPLQIGCNRNLCMHCLSVSWYVLAGQHLIAYYDRFSDHSIQPPTW